MSAKDAYARLKDIRCFLLDIDGTFYLGDRLLPGAKEFLHLCQERGIQFLFLTNNSSKNSSDYVEKLCRMGVKVPVEKILTSGEATCIYLNNHKHRARVFLVGTSALKKEFEAHGFILVQENPDYVVLGFDTTLTYAKLWKLCDYVRAGLPYIATHPDFNCPTEEGYMPDTGAMIAFVAASTGRQPDVVVGKPNQPMLDAVLEKTGVALEQIAIVGDRLYTDIAMGKSRILTILVRSGETKTEDLKSSEFIPDLILQNIGELRAYMFLIQ